MCVNYLLHIYIYMTYMHVYSISDESDKVPPACFENGLAAKVTQISAFYENGKRIGYYIYVKGQFRVNINLYMHQKGIWVVDVTDLRKNQKKLVPSVDQGKKFLKLVSLWLKSLSQEEASNAIAILRIKLVASNFGIEESVDIVASLIRLDVQEKIAILKSIDGNERVSIVSKYLEKEIKINQNTKFHNVNERSSALIPSNNGSEKGTLLNEKEKDDGVDELDAIQKLLKECEIPNDAKVITDRIMKVKIT